MKDPNATTLRRLLPVFGVAAVLGFAALAPSSAFGLTNAVGYGYGNNCGVKGYGTHDHGKTCPNRPFPGKGKGLAIAVTKGEPATGAPPRTSAGHDESTNVETTNDETTGTDSSSNQQPSGSSHSHGKGHGKGRGGD